MKKKIGWNIGLIFWTILIFILCTMPIPKVEAKGMIPHLDKIAHFGLFFIFSIFLLGFLRVSIKRSKTFSIVVVLLIAGSYGGIIEWLQGDFFKRSADILDWWADMLGVFMGIVAHKFIMKE